MLDVLVLKNAAECTSQRLKRTSGARVMNLSLSEYSLIAVRYKGSNGVNKK